MFLNVWAKYAGRDRTASRLKQAVSLQEHRKKKSSHQLNRLLFKDHLYAKSI